MPRWDAQTARRWTRVLHVPLLLAMAGCAGNRGVDSAVEADPVAQLASEGPTLRERAQLAVTEPYWPYRLATLQFAADSSAAGERSLDLALARDARYAPAVSLKSKRLYGRGEYAAGAALLRAALDAGASPRGPLEAGLALQLEALGELDEADALAARLDPAEGDIAPALGFLTLRGPDPFNSEPLLRAAAAAAPGSAAAANNLGIGLLYAGRPEDAAAEFERALSLDPDCAGAYYNLAIVDLHYRFDESAAREHYLAYRRLAPAGGDDPDALGRSLADGGGAGEVALTREDVTQETQHDAN